MKKKNYLEFDGLDLELFFSTEILKLESLHYGYWNPNEKLTLENLRKAQQRYTTTLIKLIPRDVTTILDVGCGVGDIAHTLVRKGFIVTAISPDKNHGKFFDKHLKNLSFFNKKFEEFVSNKKYDLILMSESQNYFDTEIGFQQCKRYLKPGGYLLISGMFRKEKSEAFKAINNTEEEYLRKANQFGLRLLKRVDITKQVIPTLVMAQNAIQEYLKPTLMMANHYINSSPLKATVLRWIFWKQVKDAKNILHYYQERTNPSLFEQKVKYTRLLFQIVEDNKKYKKI